MLDPFLVVAKYLQKQVKEKVFILAHDFRGSVLGWFDWSIHLEEHPGGRIGWWKLVFSADKQRRGRVHERRPGQEMDPDKLQIL